MVKIEPGRLREPAAWIMLAVVCTQVLVGIGTLLFGGGGSFGVRSASTLGRLTSPVDVALALGAIVLVTRVGEPTQRARLVNLVAVAALAVATLFGFIGLLGVLVGGTGVIENLLTGLPALGLTAVGLVYAFSILPSAAPSTARPRRQSYAEQPAPHGNGQGLYQPQPPMAEQPSYAQAQNVPPNAVPTGLPALPPAPYIPQPYTAADQRPPQSYAQQAGTGPYPQPQFGQHMEQQFAQPAEPQAQPYAEPQAQPYAEPQAQPYVPVSEGNDAYAPQHSQPLEAYASALRSEPYAQGSPADLHASQASGSYGQQAASPYAPQPSGPYGEQGQQGQQGWQPAPQAADISGQGSPAGQPQGSDPYASHAASPYPPQGGGIGAFGISDAFTTGSRQAVPTPEPLTAFDQPPWYGQPAGAYGQTGPQPSPLDVPSSYGQTGPQLDQPSSYGQTGPQAGPLDLPSSYGQSGLQPSALDQPSYGQTGPQPSALDQPSYGQTGPQTSPLEQTATYGELGQAGSYGQTGPQQGSDPYGGYPAADFGRQPEPSPLYAEAADPRQQQIAQAYQQAQTYQQSQGGPPSDGRSEQGVPDYSGTQPVRSPEYDQSYGGSPFGHPQMPLDSSGYPRTQGDAQYRPAQEQQPYPQPPDQSYQQSQDQPYPQAQPQDHNYQQAQPYPQPRDQPYQQAQDQPYQQPQPGWDEPPGEKTVRFDPKAFQNDPLNAPMPPPGSQGRRDEPIDPTAIYAPDRSSQARAEESAGRDQAGPGVDQASRWYGSDR